MQEEFRFLLSRDLCPGVVHAIRLVVSLEAVQEVLGSGTRHVEVSGLDGLELDCHGSLSCGSLEHFVVGEEGLFLLHLELIYFLLLNFFGVRSVCISLDYHDSDDKENRDGHLTREDYSLTLGKIKEVLSERIFFVVHEDVGTHHSQNRSSSTVEVIARLLNFQTRENPVKVFGMLEPSRLVQYSFILSLKLFGKVFLEIACREEVPVFWLSSFHLELCPRHELWLLSWSQTLDEDQTVLVKSLLNHFLSDQFVVHCGCTSRVYVKSARRLEDTCGDVRDEMVVLRKQIGVAGVLLPELEINELIDALSSLQLTETVLAPGNMLVVLILLDLVSGALFKISSDVLFLHEYEFFHPLGLLLRTLEVALHAHILSLQLLRFHRFFVALQNVSLDAVQHWLDVFFVLVVEAHELQLDFVEHKEAEDEDLWHHI